MSSYIKVAFAIIIIAIAGTALYYHKNTRTNETLHVIDHKQLESITKSGYSEAEKAVALRDKIVKEGRGSSKFKYIKELAAAIPHQNGEARTDFNKIKNIPEFADNMSTISSYYESALKDQPKKLIHLTKLIKNANKEFNSIIKFFNQLLY